MKKIKKTSLYISLLLIPSILSGCGTVEHAFRNNFKKSTDALNTSSSLLPEQVLFNAESLSANDNFSEAIRLEEFGPSTNLSIKRSTKQGYSGLCIAGVLYNYDFNLDVKNLVSLYLYDINNDGYRDLCITLNDNRGNYVFIYDLKKEDYLFQLESITRFEDHSGYSFLLDNNAILGVECITDVDSTSITEYGIVSYNSAFGVYVDWNNYLNISGFVLTVTDRSGNALVRQTVNSTFSKASATLSVRDINDFYIKPLGDVKVGTEYMHIALRNRGIGMTPQQNNPSDYSSENGYRFDYAYSYGTTNYNEDTRIAVHCSGYSLNLDLIIRVN